MGRMAKAVNLCPCQVRWFACVLGAAAWRPWLGMKLGRTWLCIQLGTAIRFENVSVSQPSADRSVTQPFCSG